MASPPPNPNKVIATINGVQITCSTEAGAAYVKKITHPPCVIPNEYCGIPDSASPNVVMMETKGEGNFPPIITYPSTSTSTVTANSQKMLFLSPSGSKVASYVFNYVNSTVGTGWVQAISFSASGSTYPAVSNLCGVSQNNGGYNFANFSNDYNSIRSSYKSETFYLNATNFNDQGTVATAKFKPNIIHATSSVGLLSLHKDCPRSQANLVKCLHSMGVKPKLNTSTGDYHIIDDDKLKTGDYPFDYSYQIIEMDNISAQANNGGGANAILSSPMWTINSLLPTTTTDVLNMSSKSSTRPAREGSFVVHQHVDDISSFVSNPSLNATGGTITPGSLNGNVVCLIRGLITGGSGNSTYTYAPLYSDPTYGSPSTGNYPYFQALDTPWNNLDWSITLFDGLTLPSTTGTTLSSVPYITIKSYSGLEGQVSVYSSLRPFQRVLPPPDRLALDCATTIFHARPDDLPAAANDLASIGSTIVKFIPTAIEWIKDLFGKKKEAPPPPPQVKPKQPPAKTRSRSRTPQRQIQPQRASYSSNVRQRSQAPMGRRQLMQQQEPVQQLPRSNGNGMGMPVPKTTQQRRR
jgi:hypothetical protein